MGLALLAARKIWSPLEKLTAVRISQIAVAIIRPKSQPFGGKKAKPIMEPSSIRQTAINTSRTIEFLLFALINSHIVNFEF